MCISSVSKDIDVSLHKEDHRASVVRFTRQIVIQPFSRRRPVPKSSLQTIASDWCPVISPIGWGIDVHTHAQQLQDDLIDSCINLQSTQARLPLKTTMSQDTWKLVCAKRDVRNQLTCHRGAQHHTVYLPLGFVVGDMPLWIHALLVFRQVLMLCLLSRMV